MVAVQLVNAVLPRPSGEHTNWPAIKALLPHALATAEAEPLFQPAITIDEKTLGSEYPGLATRLNNLATFYEDTGRYAEAEPLFQRAIAILEKALPPRVNA